MDVIRVYPDLFKRNAVALFNFCAYLLKGLLAVRTPEYGSPILYGGYEVIVYLMRIMFSSPDRSHTLMVS